MHDSGITLDVGGQTGTLETKEFPGMTLLIADKGPVTFDYVAHPKNADGSIVPVIWGKSSDDSYYIKPTTKPHVLPQYAAIPILYGDIWKFPGADHMRRVRDLITSTTGVGDLSNPEWFRITRMLGTLEDKHMPYTIALSDTDMGWQQRYYHKTFGGPAREGWYHGTAFRSGANGYDNHHYQRLFWMGMRMAFAADEPDGGERLWPYFLQNLISHVAHGRFWGGPNDGAARDEKGTNLIGDSNRVPASKQWIGNVVMGSLMTSQHPVFTEVIDRCARWWFNKGANGAWKGYWGVRQAARFLEEMILIGLTRPTLRSQAVRHAENMLQNLATHFDRNASVWPNLGNSGFAEESPWMAVQAVAACFRTWEQLPETKGTGLPPSDLIQILKVIFSDYGSSQIGNFRLLRYRYHTVQKPVAYVVNTAWAVPALRFAINHDDTGWAERQFKETSYLIQNYADATLAQVQAGTPTDPVSIGFRHPPQGGAWTKSMLACLEATR